MAPSKDSFSGAPVNRTFNPERSPVSAAKKLLSVTLASTGSPRQTNRPLAPKLFEIEGQASDRSTSVSRSSIPFDSSRILTVPRVDAQFRERHRAR